MAAGWQGDGVGMPRLALFAVTGTTLKPHPVCSLTATLGGAALRRLTLESSARHWPPTSCLPTLRGASRQPNGVQTSQRLRQRPPPWPPRRQLRRRLQLGLLPNQPPPRLELIPTAPPPACLLRLPGVQRQRPLLMHSWQELMVSQWQSCSRCWCLAGSASSPNLWLPSQAVTRHPRSLARLQQRPRRQHPRRQRSRLRRQAGSSSRRRRSRSASLPRRLGRRRLWWQTPNR